MGLARTVFVRYRRPIAVQRLDERGSEMRAEELLRGVWGVLQNNGGLVLLLLIAWAVWLGWSAVRSRPDEEGNDGVSRRTGEEPEDAYDLLGADAAPAHVASFPELRPVRGPTPRSN